MGQTAILWFRNDLRLSDNRAVDAALRSGLPVVPVYVHSPQEEGAWAPGSASRVWLHESLLQLDDSLRRRGSTLTIRRGRSTAELARLAQECGTGALYFSRRYDEAGQKQERELASSLAGRLRIEGLPGWLLLDPAELRSSSGEPYRVFTPFYNALLRSYRHSPPLPAPANLTAPGTWPGGLQLADLGLLPRVDWTQGIRGAWKFGEAAAQARLGSFLGNSAGQYLLLRDLPALEGTSRLSPHLHFGELSVRQAWDAALQAQEATAAAAERAGIEGFMRQLVWREFSQQLLHHFPQTAVDPLRPEFASFPWREDAALLEAWQQGRTGYPLVDAGMRQLWSEGWMHNRVRMVVASLLVKHLLQPWQNGARWFWDTLVDADLGNNTMGWQWTAGCGADAAPYFRVFNPALQSGKFDQRGEYIRRYVPELSELPAEQIHEPWKADPLSLAAAGVELGRTYPFPVIAHEKGRERALAAYRRMRSSPGIFDG